MDDGRLTIGGVPVQTKEESDVFETLGLRYVEPKERNGWEDCVSI